MSKHPTFVAAAAGTLAALLFASGARAELTNKGGAAYAAQCQSEGVPLPPRWGSSSWIYNGALAPNQSFNDPADFSLIYYYVSTTYPQGICLANPRPFYDESNGAAGNLTNLFGVICQGSNGKVCFWDTPGQIGWDSRNGQTIYSQTGVITSTDPAQIPKPPLWVGGADIPGNRGICTDCHAGENPFINHPGTATDVITKLSGTNRSFWFTGHWPDPIVRASDPSIIVNGVSGGAWPQNPGPGTFPSTTNPALGANDASCLSCHTAGGTGGRFPELSMQLPNYCSTILGEARDRTPNPNQPTGAMPPFVPTPPVTYDVFWDAMYSGCDAPAPQGTIVMPPSVEDPLPPWISVAPQFAMTAG
jgi:hypothetical protein